ncbi:hypothetical protein BD779DRAFT_614264 [Infundibulicybe gibba]|nr:hypothetical protein BD779DRAFT_614264 [Infundibulicybe gibba]
MSTSPSPPSLTTSHSNSVSPPVRTPPGSGHRSGFGPRSAFGVVNNSQRQSHKQPQKSPSVNKGHRGRTRRDTESDVLESDGDGDKTVTEVIMTPRPVLGQQQTRRRPQYPMLGVTSPHLNSSLDLPAGGTARSRTPNVPGGETRVPCTDADLPHVRTTGGSPSRSWI